MKMEVIEPNSKGVYKIRYEYTDANGNVTNKLSTMFPDDKSEIQVAKTIESIYKDKITNPNNIKIDPTTGGKYLEGIDSFNNATIRIDLFNNNSVSTAYPIYD